jgi:hypothetical protein
LGSYERKVEKEDDMTSNMISTPALVLTIGASLAPAVADVKRIFIQSDPRRNATTRFLALTCQTGKPGLTEVGSLDSGKRQNNIPREQILETARDGTGSIRAGIRSALHELRSHEKLIEVGLGGKTTLPLDVMVIAELAETDAAALEMLLPVIYTLLADEPYAKVHLLLSVAVFSENPQAGANVHDALQSLRSILEDKGQSNLPQVYLFDRYKEGVWEARDAGELQTILGNFLLALLSGGLAQRLAHQVTQLDVEEKGAYFCGASATLLVFDVELLQKACAMRLGAEILEAEFHSKVVPDPAPVEEMAQEFALSHANPQAWTSRLCRESIFHARGEMDVELHFSDLRFEDLPMEDWKKTIQAYDDAFKEKQLPIQADLIGRNAGELDNEFLGQMAQFIQSLPQQARLYPGGVRASLAVVEWTQKNFLGMQFTPGDSSAIENEWNEKIKTSLGTLEQAMQNLPKPPRWVFRLPACLRKPAVQLFNLVFLYRELKMLTDLRQNSIRLMEQKYEALMRETVIQKMNERKTGWESALEKHKKSLKRLQSALDKLQGLFSERTIELISSPSLFRLSALDESVLAWAYYYGKRPQDGFRHALLTERGFLNEWQKSNINTFEERLESFCKEVYQPLSSTDLEEALHHRDGKDAAFLALSLTQGAVPLLRPNFDQTGSGSSFQLRFFQCKDPLSSSLYSVFNEDEQDWELIETDDLLIASCCRVRMMIPFSALTHIFERGTPQT